MLLGKQGIALRGHRDDKVEWIEQADTEINNQGNSSVFEQILILLYAST